MREPSVAIVVANYNGHSYVYEGKCLLDLCLKPLLKTDYGNYKVIVTDDCSTDDSIEYIKNHYKEVYVTKTKENGRFAKNNNNGMRYALKSFDPDYVLLISNDVIAKEKDWLTKLIEVAESKKDIGLVGPKLIYPDGRIQSAGIPFNNFLRLRGQTEDDKPEYSKVEQVQGVIAVTVLIKRSVINKIGILDENFKGNFEDVDYCLRVGEAGFSVIYAGNVKLVHLHSYTSKMLSKIPKNRDAFLYEEQRNYAYFILKHSKGLSIVPSFFWLMSRAIVVRGEHGHIGITNFRIEGPVFKKLGISMKAWNDGVELYNSTSNASSAV